MAGLIVLIVLRTQPSTAPAEARREDDLTVRTRRF